MRQKEAHEREEVELARRVQESWKGQEEEELDRARRFFKQL
jgi:hypothetical protein